MVLENWKTHSSAVRRNEKTAMMVKRVTSTPRTKSTPNISRTIFK